MREHKNQQDLKDKMKWVLGLSFLLLILATIVYVFYLIGLFYSGLILMGGSVLGLRRVLMRDRRYLGLDWVSRMSMPFVGLFFMLGLALFSVGL